MRPAMMLLLRALVILGAVLAVISCGNPAVALTGPAVLMSAPGSALCSAAFDAWQAVPVAGGTLSGSGTGTCL
ncbi:MAG TPA: hypothetical protein VG454_07995 [Gemmatimonadales bacterium]|nr:hypothetical protein [Gemmatimonadales bacterium]